MPACARRFTQIHPLRRAMITNRQWMAFCLAGACWSSVAFAQQGAGGGSSGANAASGSTTSGATTSGTTPSGTTPAGTTSGTTSSGVKSPDSKTSGTMPSGAKPADPGATDPTTPGGTPTPGTTPTPGRSVDPFIPTTPAKPTEKPGSTTTGPGESSSFGTPRESQIPTLERSGGTPKPADATGETGTTGESSAVGPDSTASKPNLLQPTVERKREHFG